MVVVAQILAAIAYLIPVAGVLLLRSHRDRPVWQLGLDVPMAVALDLIVVLSLARIVTLETATLVSRIGWLAVSSLAYRRAVRRGNKPTWPEGLSRSDVVGLALVVVAAVLISLRLSRPCAIWDRNWHIPLVASLRGQRLPFMNVYDVGSGLFYHFAGDVQAAMLQTLSGGVLHASLALSLAHDIMFALLAGSLTLFLRRLGVRSAWLAFVVFAAVVLMGPVTLLRDGVRKLDSGFAIVNYLTLSYRPHVSLGYLLQLGFVGVVAVGLLEGRQGQRRADWLPHLVATTAALVITDESSLGLLGVALGMTWLVYPTVLGPRRRDGALVLLALLGAIVAAAVLFVGSVGPGTPRYAVEFVAPRIPGYASPPLPLTDPVGRAMLLQDLLPLLGVLLGTLLVVLRTRDRTVRQALIFFAGLFVVSVLALCCVEVEHKPVESHRFMTAAFVAAPLVAILVLSRLVVTNGLPRLADPGALLIYATLGLAMASTVEWLESGVARRQCGHHGLNGFRSGELVDVNCRRDTGAQLGESSQPTYVDSQAFYLYAGCHPLISSAPPIGAGEHKVKVGRPWFGRPALEALGRGLQAGRSLAVACPALTTGVAQDAVCVRATTIGHCEPSGSQMVTCPVDPATLR